MRLAYKHTHISHIFSQNWKTVKVQLVEKKFNDTICVQKGLQMLKDGVFLLFPKLSSIFFARNRPQSKIIFLLVFLVKIPYLKRFLFLSCSPECSHGQIEGSFKVQYFKKKLSDCVNFCMQPGIYGS